MSVLDTPLWLTQYVEQWQKKLLLSEWRIKIKIALAPNNDVNALAICETVSNIHSATLTFRADIEQNQDSEETIIHEVLHVRHALTDQAIWSMLTTLLPESDRQLIYISYSNEMERFIDGMSKILWKMDQPQPLRLEVKEQKDAV